MNTPRSLWPLSVPLTCLLVLLAIRPAFALVFQYSYDDAGQLASVTTGPSLLTSYYYDSAGNLHHLWNQLSDTDGDGMGDAWETQYGLVVGVDDSANDPDEDGLTNYEEWYAYTNPYDSDHDDDLMPDGYEVDNDLNPRENDAQGDADGDNLSNLAEYQNNTDPQDSDSDDDGMPDGWEVAHSLSPLLDDASADPDGDGYTNYQEYRGGSDPNDPNSWPVVIVPMLQILLFD